MNTTKISRHTLANRYPKLSKIIEKQQSVFYFEEHLDLFCTALDAKIKELPFEFVKFNEAMFFRDDRKERPIFTMPVYDGRKVVAYIIEDVMVHLNHYYT